MVYYVYILTQQLKAAGNSQRCTNVDGVFKQQADYGEILEQQGIYFTQDT